MKLLKNFTKAVKILIDNTCEIEIYDENELNVNH